MKLKTYLFLFLILSAVCFGQNRIVKINQINLEFKSPNIDSLSLKTAEIYRNNKKILTHTLYHEDDDCSSVQIELGNYEIKGNQIIFHTYWAAADLQGLLVYPFGFRKQTYAVNTEGKMHLVNSEIYIEENKSGGMFLHSEPKNSKEKKLLEGYIKAVEQKYKASFVTGNKKEILIQEVRRNLKKEITDRTKNWKKLYGKNVKM